MVHATWGDKSLIRVATLFTNCVIIPTISILYGLYHILSSLQKKTKLSESNKRNERENRCNNYGAKHFTVPNNVQILSPNNYSIKLLY